MGASLPPAGKQLRVYDVRRYGAKGDGSTNDTTAIQAAIDAALTETTTGSDVFAGSGASRIRGAIVYFPPGLYRVSSLTTGSYTGHATVHFLGAGRNASKLKKVSAADTTAILTLTTGGTGGDPYDYAHHIVEELGFEGSSSNGTIDTTPYTTWKGVGVSIPQTQLGATIRRCQFDYLNYGFYSTGALMNQVDDCWFERCSYGAYLSSSGGMESNWYRFNGCRWAVCDHGIYNAGSGSGTIVMDGDFEFCNKAVRFGTAASAAMPNVVRGGWFEFNTTNVQVDSSAPQTIIDGAGFYQGAITAASGTTGFLDRCYFGSTYSITLSAGTGAWRFRCQPRPTVTDTSSRAAYDI